MAPRTGLQRHDNTASSALSRTYFQRYEVRTSRVWHDFYSDSRVRKATQRIHPRLHQWEYHSVSETPEVITTAVPLSTGAERPADHGMMRLLRAARVIHPFPTLLNVAATGALAFVAARGVPDGSVVARMVLLMFCAQSAIGIVNDLCDRELDAATKPWKPIANGLIAPRVAIVGAVGLIVLAIAIGVTLGVASLTLATLDRKSTRL